jgi:nucleoside-diphosphate-sugar epimerase
MPNTRKTALILGANGGIGSTVMHELAVHGWYIRALVRSIPNDQQKPASSSTCASTIEWRHGDAMNKNDVMRAALGADVIIHAVNPPGYRNWSTYVLPMIDNSIAAAITNRARIVLPGTVYNYGPDAFPDIDENATQQPQTRKGAIRVEMERRLEKACEHGARVLIVRAGDFFGPGAKNNWFSQGLVKTGIPVTSILYPGAKNIGHQWAYLPDMAETIGRLLAQENELSPFARFHFNGHWDETGNDMITAIRAACNNPALPVRRFPWWLIKPATPFVPFLREIDEMKYLWRQPVRLNNTRLAAFLGTEPHTPLQQAVKTTLAALKCLPADMTTSGDADPTVSAPLPGQVQSGR